MRSAPSTPDFQTADIGTPRDYTEDLYRFYLEVPDPEGGAEPILSGFLGSRHAASMRRLSHGIEFDAPLQCAPDIVRLLAGANIAVYQLVRFAKVQGNWRDAS